MSDRRPFERLAQAVVAQHEQLLLRTPAPETATIVAGVSRCRRRRQQRNYAVGALFALIVAAAVGGLARRSAVPSPVVAAAPPSVGAAALGPIPPAAGSAPLGFPDGSRVLLAAGAVAEVRAIEPNGARVALRHGTLTAEVVHTSQTSWDILAGSFDIHVTGTRFDATYDEATGRLTVAMHEGQVRVAGPCLDEALGAPATKVFVCPTPTVATPTVATPTPDPAPQRPPPEGQGASMPCAVSGTCGQPIEEVAPAETVLAHADELRLAGNSLAARRSYRRVRERFPHTEAAAKAAFLLGRMAEDGGSLDDAAATYRAVAGERPSSPFVQSALGRTLELEHRRGRITEARALARKYLDAYPSGAHAAFASSLLKDAP